MDQVTSRKPLISEAERGLRQEAINYGRGGVRPEGLSASPEAEALFERYIEDERTDEELTQAILNLHRA